MTGIRIVDVPTAARRDPQRATVRLLPLALFPGLPLPGEPVGLRMAGTFRPVPGHILFIHWLDGVVAVEPDLQLVHGIRPPGTLQPSSLDSPGASHHPFRPSDMPGNTHTRSTRFDIPGSKPFPARRAQSPRERSARPSGTTEQEALEREST